VGGAGGETLGRGIASGNDEQVHGVLSLRRRG
jgi:hypothetical protein